MKRRSKLKRRERRRREEKQEGRKKRRRKRMKRRINLCGRSEILDAINGPMAHHTKVRKKADSNCA